MVSLRAPLRRRGNIVYNYEDNVVNIAVPDPLVTLGGALARCKGRRSASAKPPPSRSADTLGGR
jgi:hypothetical protein